MNIIGIFFKSKLELLFSLVASVFVTLAVIGAIRNYSPVPIWDMWNGYLDFYVRVNQGDWYAWWAQHNEHRILLARLFFWMDLEWFGGAGWFLILINYLLLGLICIVFLSALREHTKNTTCLIGYFIVSWLFSWSQQMNLVWGFQIQFFLVQLLPLCAFYSMHKSANLNKNASVNFGASIVFGVLSIAAMANGVLVLPLMTLFAFLIRLSLKKCFLLVFASVASIWCYFNDYHAVTFHGSITQALVETPVGLFQFILLYLGGPFYYISGSTTYSIYIAKFMGGFLIISSMFFASRSLRTPRQSTLDLALLFFILFIGGTALGTAGGRLSFGVNMALTSRYMTPALMAWSALIILYIPHILKPGKAISKKIWLPLLLLLISMLPLQLSALISKKEIIFEREVASLALELGVKDAPQIANVSPTADVNWALSFARKPADLDLSIFGMTPIKNSRERIGTQSTSLTYLPAGCIGKINDVQIIEGDSRYLQVRGWMLNPSNLSVPQSISFIDSQGLVVGIALTGQSRKDVAAEINLPVVNSGFKGYLRADQRGKLVELEGVNIGCKLSTKVPVSFFNIIKVAPLSTLATASILNVLPGNEWTGSDYYNSRFLGMSVFGSFIHGDADTGSITLRLKRGDKLFYRTGPTGGRQFIEFLESTYPTITMPVELEWVQLDITNIDLEEKFTVTFTDKGDGWGEWSALALKAE